MFHLSFFFVVVRINYFYFFEYFVRIKSCSYLNIMLINCLSRAYLFVHVPMQAHVQTANNFPCKPVGHHAHA